MSDVQPVGMPKWGLSMTRGQVGAWIVDVGDEVSVGDDVVEIETEKINGVVESAVSGVVRRRVVDTGAWVPVGGLLAVVADPSVPEEEIDRFVEEFQAGFVPEEEDTEDGEAGPETVEVGGRAIRYARWGESGDPVVLVHGFGGDLGNWLFTAPALAERHRVYALDLPGHGGSAKNVEPGDLASLAQTLLGFLAVNGIDRAHLVGHSMGGLVAMAAALRDPRRVASLALIGSAGFGTEMDGAYIDGFVGAGSRRELKPVLQRLFADQGLVTRQLVDDVLKYKRLDGVGASLRLLADELFPGGAQRHVLAGDVGALGLPVLVVWGDRDQVVPPSHAANAPAGARVSVLEGAGHSPHMERANDVNRLLEGFLSGA
ncbi:pyruvate dehydrogenase E2 component (dihydrolipoamide acetyltransferase) [Streptosporangium becharense]|uniref:Pyruvate dehydrogenase E2 component (Dihydrolipoamide acetyltransferase) n=1 Tax=Streptosporangium becharense TaxID=1816182 RepID=A0A7W9MFM0_9ACTN|nr:acetoin dehydrogenase dihydrolipoyllysine-residue acetyltransferase subunit [Streptosporangium becharense]MBB2911987.1 pyruvate dehydrogenase E2 component (dihydrolipoamide acetyltransferase) [Streptosporangium becharense]MBB5818534.1 pyruvate dehydrogenase E2 component (dihydrolipoamide acetyltransferase) [Streptosporangium becharense]